MSLIKVAWYVLRVKNMHFGSPPDPGPGVHRAALGRQPQSLSNSKILLMKVVGYDLLIIENSPQVVSTYFVASGKLQSEANVLPLTPIRCWVKQTRATYNQF